MRIGWLAPLPWFSEFHVGVQNPQGETMVSFLANDEVFAERPIGGRPFVEREVDSADDLVYLLRWVNAWNVGRTVTGQLGASALFGPNTTGPDGRTIMYGADLKVTWRPVRNFRGWPFIRWQTEFLQRNYTADAFTGEVDGALVTLPRQTLYDWGGYTQVLYGFIPRWAGGIRLEYATGMARVLMAGTTTPSATRASASHRCWRGTYRNSPGCVCNTTTIGLLISQTTGHMLSGSCSKASSGPIRHTSFEEEARMWHCMQRWSERRLLACLLMVLWTMPTDRAHPNHNRAVARRDDSA